MKKSNIKFIERKTRRCRRTRKKIYGTPECPRLAVYRALNNIYAQLIDDTSGATLLAVSTKSEGMADSLKEVKGKVAAATLVGKALAAQAKEKNITRAVFDRRSYIYHGRVKALADAAREGGLIF